MLRVIGDERPDRAVRERAGYQRQASRLIQHQEHDCSTECIEGHETLADLGFLRRFTYSEDFLGTLKLRCLHKSSLIEFHSSPIPEKEVVRYPANLSAS